MQSPRSRRWTLLKGCQFIRYLTIHHRCDNQSPINKHCVGEVKCYPHIIDCFKLYVAYFGCILNFFWYTVTFRVKLYVFNRSNKTEQSPHLLLRSSRSNVRYRYNFCISHLLESTKKTSIFYFIRSEEWKSITIRPFLIHDCSHLTS